MLFFAETVSQAQLASLEARHTVSSCADEGRPNMAAAPLTRERTGTGLAGIRRVVGGVVLPACQSHRCHLEVTALHTTSNGPRRQRALVTEKRATSKQAQIARSDWAACHGLGLAELLLPGLLLLQSSHSIAPVTCRTANGRIIFDKYLSQGTPRHTKVAQTSRRLAHFADEQQSKMCQSSALRRVSGNARL